MQLIALSFFRYLRDRFMDELDGRDAAIEEAKYNLNSRWETCLSDNALRDNSKYARFSRWTTHDWSRETRFHFAASGPHRAPSAGRFQKYGETRIIRPPPATMTTHGKKRIVWNTEAILC